MLSVVLRRTLPKVVASTPKNFACRAFSGAKLTIPVDNEQQTGRRKEEMDAEAAGDVGFNRDPIIPADDAGTKENPILVIFVTWATLLNMQHLLTCLLSCQQQQKMQVPSGAHVRAVGYEDPASHQLVWFNLTAGPLHYVPDIGLYFKLKAI